MGSDRLDKPGPRGPAQVDVDQGSSVWLLLCYGAASALLYLTFVRLFPLARYAAYPRLFDLMGLVGRSTPGVILYVLLVLAAFGLYWQAWHLVWCSEGGDRVHKLVDARLRLAVIAGGAMLCALVLMWMYPINANDLFRYLFRSRIWTLYGGNPLVDPPSRFATDPYMYMVGEWVHHRSPYGPAWELLAAGASLLSGGAVVPNLLALKAISVLSFGGSTLLVYAVLGQVQPARRASGTLLLAWNPLILLEWIGNGHNDALMLLLILLGIYLWSRGRRIWVLPVFAIAMLVKAIAVLVVPFFLIDIWLCQPDLGARFRWLVGTSLLAAAVVVLLFVPFGPLWQNVGGVWEEASGRYGFSLPGVLFLVLHDLAIPLGLLTLSRFYILPPGTQLALYRYADALPRMVALAVLAFLYLRQFGKVWRRKQSPIAASTEAFFAYLILAPSFRMWYPSWSVALAPLCPDRDRSLRVGTISLTAELSAAIYGHMLRWGQLPGYILGVTFTQLLSLLSPWLGSWVRRQQKGGGGCGGSSGTSRQAG